MNINKEEAVLIIGNILELRGNEGFVKILGQDKFNSLIKEMHKEIKNVNKEEYMLHNISFLNKCAELILNK